MKKPEFDAHAGRQQPETHLLETNGGAMGADGALSFRLMLVNVLLTVTTYRRQLRGERACEEAATMLCEGGGVAEGDSASNCVIRTEDGKGAALQSSKPHPQRHSLLC